MPTPHSAARRRLELALETAGTLIRKTSLQDRSDGGRSGAADCFSVPFVRRPARAEFLTIRLGTDRGRTALGSISSSRCQITRILRRNCAPGCETLGASGRENSPGWWSQTGSNRRPPACKAGALPTELWPLQVSGIRSQQSGRSLRARHRITDP